VHLSHFPPFPLLIHSLLSAQDALQHVLKNALVHDGLARGLREAAKALDKRQAHLCVLNESCTEGEYVKLIEALCAEHKINLIKISDPKLLGEWAGLCKVRFSFLFFSFFVSPLFPVYLVLTCYLFPCPHSSTRFVSLPSSLFPFVLVVVVVVVQLDLPPSFFLYRAITDPALNGPQEGVARKVVGCSCVVVKDYGQESEALSILLEYFAQR
jgi:ribosomal protein L7Ae-like RNA K-turn-binding protein